MKSLDSFVNEQYSTHKFSSEKTNKFYEDLKKLWNKYNADNNTKGENELIAALLNLPLDILNFDDKVQYKKIKDAFDYTVKL